MHSHPRPPTVLLDEHQKKRGARRRACVARSLPTARKGGLRAREAHRARSPLGDVGRPALALGCPAEAWECARRRLCAWVPCDALACPAPWANRPAEAWKCATTAALGDAGAPPEGATPEGAPPEGAPPEGATPEIRPGEHETALGARKRHLGSENARKSPLGRRKSLLGRRKSPLGRRKSPLGRRKSPLGLENRFWGVENRLRVFKKHRKPRKNIENIEFYEFFTPGWSPKRAHRPRARGVGLRVISLYEEHGRLSVF